MSGCGGLKSNRHAAAREVLGGIVQVLDIGPGLSNLAAVDFLPNAQADKA